VEQVAHPNNSNKTIFFVFSSSADVRAACRLCCWPIPCVSNPDGAHIRGYVWHITASDACVLFAWS
jgi:hypothetical protein